MGTRSDFLLPLAGAILVTIFVNSVLGQGSNLNQDANQGSPCYELDEDGQEDLTRPQVRPQIC